MAAEEEAVWPTFCTSAWAWVWRSWTGSASVCSGAEIPAAQRRAHRSWASGRDCVGWWRSAGRSWLGYEWSVDDIFDYGTALAVAHLALTLPCQRGWRACRFYRGGAQVNGPPAGLNFASCDSCPFLTRCDSCSSSSQLQKLSCFFQQQW
jgi:hypothetical protein